MGKGRDKRRRKSTPPFRPLKVEPPSPDPLAPFASVLSPLRPRPTLCSGAVALPEPDEAEILPDLISAPLFR
jgi:hypothetical protein